MPQAAAHRQETLIIHQAHQIARAVPTYQQSWNQAFKLAIATLQGLAQQTKPRDSGFLGLGASDRPDVWVILNNLPTTGEFQHALYSVLQGYYKLKSPEQAESVTRALQSLYEVSGWIVTSSNTPPAPTPTAAAGAPALPVVTTGSAAATAQPTSAALQQQLAGVAASAVGERPLPSAPQPPSATEADPTADIRARYDAENTRIAAAFTALEQRLVAQETVIQATRSQLAEARQLMAQRESLTLAIAHIESLSQERDTAQGHSAGLAADMRLRQTREDATLTDLAILIREDLLLTPRDGDTPNSDVLLARLQSACSRALTIMMSWFAIEYEPHAGDPYNYRYMRQVGRISTHDARLIACVASCELPGFYIPGGEDGANDRIIEVADVYVYDAQ